MGGEESSSSPSPENFSGDRSSGSPIRVLVFFHKAFRGELGELVRIAEDAVSPAGDGDECDKRRRKTAAVELRRRLEFFRTVFWYHCAAEDEVIFFALDARVKNIACTYYLEHHIIDSIFESIFSRLNGILENHENSCQEFQELTFHISTLQGSICQHMLKEEQQVFPLLVSQFSDEEQGFLLWQLMCSVPVVLMEDLFPWLACFLAPEEQFDLKHTMKKIVPQDKMLQEVMISWIDKTTQPSSGGCINYDASSQDCPDEVDDLRDSLLKTSFDKSCQSELLSVLKDSPFDGLPLWHAAIRSDFKEILDKLYKIGSEESSRLSSLLVRINFLTDVLIFYSDALERIFYPLLEDISVHPTSSSYKAFPCKNEIEGFQKIIFNATQINFANPRFFEMMCNKMEDLVLVTSKHLSFQETKVFPVISKNYDYETQQKLIFRSLCMLPLGLLKCVTTWFSSHLPKDKLNCILHGIKQSGFFAEPFASLLHRWICIGYSAKFTIKDLQEMFSSRVSYMFEQFRQSEDPENKLQHATTNHISVNSSNFFPHSLSKSFQQTEKHGTLYSSGINLLVFSSRALNQVYNISGSPLEAVSVNHREPRPMDHIYYFHKAIKKDLESLVLDSNKLYKNLEFFVEFNRHFRLVRSLYELHSETEDQVAFPALEAKQKVQNLTQSYSLDHKLEDDCFNRVSGILDQMSELYDTLSGSNNEVGPACVEYRQLCLKLQDSCKLLERILNDHIHREEIELWPLFREYFSTEEQEKIVGYMLGRTRAEILQKMIVWLMACLTSEEQQAMMNYWRKATKYTKFDEWLGEWWEGMESYVCAEVEKPEIPGSSAMGSIDLVAKHSSMGVSDRGKNSKIGNVKFPYDEASTINMVKKMEGLDKENKKHKSSENIVLFGETEKHKREGNLNNSVSELEAAIRKVSQDSSLDLQEKTRIMQDLRTSHWVAQSLPDSNGLITSESGRLPGQFPSYRDTGGSIFGCKHYKQNCKLVAACCNQIFTCRRCHDEVSDHLMDRESTTQMMCMMCLEIQPIGPTCQTPSCNKFSMARHYCKICRLFDDNREIYHCPYCNLCRLGKGLGIDYFHCMKCNACMNRSLSSSHVCREKCIEDKCPICHEDMFTSSDPVKALACGHLMHSSCFEEYTCTRYTCPVCSKSLGDMQVLFGMLDALLGEENIPEEYVGRTQAILCNDCEKKGTAAYHWLHHKCPFCGSYNTRLL
ncbi:zinc finger protein BRUTUS-like At1g18910 isoform X1 [Chenopodium quinoa]|uniref:zinc finger protein BRUTUS-like At1g18910 isoform X1 n=2 Tax=Chenopodium quinoa TaxID=63459 RepID=UPI000B76C0BF|nr:zinc finger protein BRUTUS-like At1g18910 isoform X1 [Chenopodium quinoa]